MPSHYAVLGLVDKSFTPLHLKHQYRALAKRWHPDRNRGDEQAAAEKFKALQEAFEVLSDPDKRREYDSSRHLTPRASSQPDREPGVAQQREAREKRERDAREAAMRSEEWLEEIRRRQAARGAAAAQAGDDGANGTEAISIDDDVDDGVDEAEEAEVAAALAAVAEAIRSEQAEVAAEAAAEAEALRAAMAASRHDASKGAASASNDLTRRGRLAAELNRASRALVDLAREPEPEDEASGSFDAAIPALVGLLRIRGHAVSAHAIADAAWALSTLTSASQSPKLAPHNRDAIRAAGGIEPLAALLSGGNSKAAEAAAATLWSLATHNESTLEAVLMAVIVAAPPELPSFPYLLASLRSAAAQRLRRSEALTRGGRAESKEVSQRAERAPSAALRATIADAVAVGVDDSVVQRARSRLEEIDKARHERRDALGLTTEAAREGPADFLCPVLFERMVDPVVASDGHTYEREAIMAVLGPGGSKTSPLTREPLAPHVLPNLTLLKVIRSYDEEMMHVAEKASAAALAAAKARPS